MAMWQIWLIISGLFFIGEIITTGFLLFWPALAALISMVVSIFFPNALIEQTAVFVIASGILILCTKKFVSKYINKKTVSTNAYSIIGKKAVVLSDIDTINGSGQVKVNGEVWSAKAEDEEIIKKGTEVEILKIDGVKLLVKPQSITTQLI